LTGPLNLTLLNLGNLSLPTPAIFGHRGASAFAPENTLAAFLKAVELGADGVELDTKLSADGTPVVIHDQTVDRTTNGSGRVGQLTFEQLRRLDAGSKFSPDFKGEPIPTLEEVLKTLGDRCFINVELTNYASTGDALPLKAAALVKQYHLEERVLFSSFHPLNLVRVRRALPGAATALLTLPGFPGKAGRLVFGLWVPHTCLHPHFSTVNAAWVQAAHRSQRRLHVWTVNDPQEMRRLTRLGVDGLISDDPRLARQIMEEAV